MNQILDPASDRACGDACLPYPFMLAHPLTSPLDTLGSPADWLIEWKWDGIRAQLLRCNGTTAIWSRGDEAIAPAFPELLQAAAELRKSIALDGEIVGWNEATNRPLPFLELQTRINRKQYELSFWPEMPVRFLAFDLLEIEGQDLREQTLALRRQQLQHLLSISNRSSAVVLSPEVAAAAWPQLQTMISEARNRGVEGVMLKQRSSAESTSAPLKSPLPASYGPAMHFRSPVEF